MADALKLAGVRAGYGETVVLEDIALALPERGSLAVLGRNGVGKTTLLATIMGHTTLHAGNIALNEKPMEKEPVYARSRAGIGYVPQERAQRDDAANTGTYEVIGRELTLRLGNETIGAKLAGSGRFEIFGNFFKRAAAK